MYELELGGIEEDIETVASNMGRAKPKAMLDRPQPLAGTELYLQAFYHLDGERQIGMSIGRIPWSAVEHYADVGEFTAAQTIALHKLIGKMDAANLNRLRADVKGK